MGVGHRKSIRRRDEQWKDILERFDSSGLSVKAFCGAESISTASYYRWRQRLGKVGERAQAIEGASFIELGPLEGRPAWDIELELGGGLVLRLRRG